MSTANGSPSDQSPAPAAPAPAPAPAPAAAAASAPPPPSSASPPPPSQPSQAIASPTQPPLVTQVTQQSQSQSQSQPSSNSHPASQPLTQLPSLPVASSSQPDGKDKDGKDKDGKDREKEGDGEDQLSDLFAARREEEIARRDRSLAEFLVMLDGYKPLIPEEVTEYYLQRAGFECQDPRLKRLLSLSAQKFVSDLSRDAFHFAKLRVNSTTAGRGRPSAGVDRNRVVLTMDDLSLALGEHGVNVKKPDYYL